MPQKTIMLLAVCVLASSSSVMECRAGMGSAILATSFQGVLASKGADDEGVKSTVTIKGGGGACSCINGNCIPAGCNSAADPAATPPAAPAATPPAGGSCSCVNGNCIPAGCGSKLGKAVLGDVKCHGDSKINGKSCHDLCKCASCESTDNLKTWTCMKGSLGGSVCSCVNGKCTPEGCGNSGNLHLGTITTPAPTPNATAPAHKDEVKKPSGGSSCSCVNGNCIPAGCGSKLGKAVLGDVKCHGDSKINGKSCHDLCKCASCESTDNLKTWTCMKGSLRR